MQALGIIVICVVIGLCAGGLWAVLNIRKAFDDSPDELPDSDPYLAAMCRHATGELAPVHPRSNNDVERQDHA